MIFYIVLVLGITDDTIFHQQNLQKNVKFYGVILMGRVLLSLKTCENNKYSLSVMKANFSQRTCLCPICYHVYSCKDVELKLNKALPRDAKFNSDSHNNNFIGVNTLCK